MTEIEQCRNAIKEYRKGYGQSQLPTDCIIQLMIGHHRSRVNAIDFEIILQQTEFMGYQRASKHIKEQLLKQ